MSYSTSALALLATALLTVAPVKAQDNIEALVEELVQLRGQVEELNSNINRLQENHSSQMRSLAAQQGDLEATERRERLRVERLEKDLADLRTETADVGLAAEALSPVTESVMAELNRQIEQGIAFKKGERLAALSDIRDGLEAGSLSAPRAINRLWRFVEDEMRLTRENGLYSQIIQLDGEDVLADVAKIGTVALYFTTKDGRVGMASESAPGQWQFEVLDERNARAQIETLFDSLRKQIRSGFFELPNASVQLETSE